MNTCELSMCHSCTSTDFASQKLSRGVHTRPLGVPGRVSWVAYVSVSKRKDIDYELRMG